MDKPRDLDLTLDEVSLTPGSTDGRSTRVKTLARGSKRDLNQLER